MTTYFIVDSEFHVLFESDCELTAMHQFDAMRSAGIACYFLRGRRSSV